MGVNIVNLLNNKPQLNHLKNDSDVHVVLFSGGLASFEACKRVIKNHEGEEILLWFFDTLIEDPDTYRFINDCENYFETKIERLSDGRNMWQVFRDERFIGNSQKCICTRVLKRQLLERLLHRRFPKKNVILHFGLENHEKQRITKVLNGWAGKGYKVDIPLLNPPILNRAMLIEEVNSTKIQIPRLYKLGFTHNNCGGGCVRAGISQWIKLWQIFPDRYLWHEEQEMVTRDYLKKDVSILRDRRFHQTVPLTLGQLRKRIEKH